MEEKDQLALFKSYMDSRRKWVRVSESPTSATYEMHVQPQKGSCLIAFVLLCFFVLPGLLYLYYTNKPGSVEKIHVSLLENGTLKASGTSRGMHQYYAFSALHALKGMSSNRPSKK